MAFQYPASRNHHLTFTLIQRIPVYGHRQYQAKPTSEAIDLRELRFAGAFLITNVHKIAKRASVWVVLLRASVARCMAVWQPKIVA